MDGPAPLDLIFFHSGDPISQAIGAVEEQVTGRGDYSHVGIVVSSAWFPHLAHLQPPQHFLWDAMKDGNRLGTRLAPLKDVVTSYHRWFPRARTAWGKLKARPAAVDPTVLADLYATYGDVGYNCCCLCCAAWAWLRPCGRCCRHPDDKTVFCSELVAIVLQRLGLIDIKFDPAHVLPVDLLGYDQDGLPALVEEPVPWNG